MELNNSTEQGASRAVELRVKVPKHPYERDIYNLLKHIEQTALFVAENDHRGEKRSERLFAANTFASRRQQHKKDRDQFPDNLFAKYEFLVYGYNK